MHVVGRHGEAVGFVLGAFEVGQVDGDFVADFSLDGFRGDVRTDQRTKDFDLVALLVGMFFAGANSTGLRLVGAAVGADLVTDARLQLGGFDGDYVVRLAQR